MKICLLGATGSIGVQTLDVVRKCLPEAEITALSGYSNVAALAAAVDEFLPKVVCVPDDAAVSRLREISKHAKNCEILLGEQGLITCAAESNADIFVNALVGRAGLLPTLAAIEAGKNIALANKETLVTAGELVMRRAREKNVRITPIDSEHSAIWQCLASGERGGVLKSERLLSPRSALARNAPPVGTQKKLGRRKAGFAEGKTAEEQKGVNSEISTPRRAPQPLGAWAFDDLGESGFDDLVESGLEKIILTASGGPFRTWQRERIAAARADDALRHPNWDMGAKITIDSATMMNKGLELIEAMHLFGQPPEKIDILVHPQSIIHSMVQYHDGSVIAQMGLPDMRLPILYALSAPNRVKTDFPRLDFLTCGALTFEAPDFSKFPCLSLAKHAAKTGGTLPAIMNFINEWAVHRFLQEKTTFYGISDIIEQAFGIYIVKAISSPADITEAEEWAKEFVSCQ